MPYLSDSKRVQALEDGATPLDAAELTYALTIPIRKFLQAKRARDEDNFDTFSNVRKALQSADDEFAQTVMRPYEETKRYRNMNNRNVYWDDPPK